MAITQKEPQNKTATKKASGRGLGAFGVEPYKPKQNEEYMSEGQLQHFRTILERWKDTLMQEVDRTIDHLRTDSENLPRFQRPRDSGNRFRTRAENP